MKCTCPFGTKWANRNTFSTAGYTWETYKDKKQSTLKCPLGTYGLKIEISVHFRI